MTPPMFDPSNIVVWKYRMSMYLKTLGLHVFLAATKRCYLGDVVLHQMFAEGVCDLQHADEGGSGYVFVTVVYQGHLTLKVVDIVL